MALSDCVSCWMTPCECGFSGYLNLRPKDLNAFLALSSEDRELIHRSLEGVLDSLIVELKSRKQK